MIAPGHETGPDRTSVALTSADVAHGDEVRLRVESVWSRRDWGVGGGRQGHTSQRTDDRATGQIT